MGIKKQMFKNFLAKWHNKAKRYGIFYEKIWEKFRVYVKMPTLIDMHDWQSEYHVFIKFFCLNRFKF